MMAQRDFVRYSRRAIRACLAGRVVFFYHWNKERGTTVLLVLVRMPDGNAALAVALESFQNGRV